MTERCHACGGWLRAEDTHCPTCQEPVAGQADDHDPLALDDSELELDVAPTSAPAPASSPGWDSYGGGAGDPFDDPLAMGDDGPGLELDEDAARRPSGPGAASAPDAAAAAAAPSAPAQPSRSGPAPAEPPAPAQQPSGPADPGPVEVAHAAGYPEPPSSLLGSLTYVAHVLQRRHELQGERRRAASQRQVAERHAETALADLGALLYERAGELGSGELAPQLQLVAQTASQAQQTGQQRERVEQDASSQRAALEAQIEAAHQDANPLRDRETRLRTQLEAREHDLKRAQAQARRVEIELRNQQQAEAPDASRIEMLQADRQAKQADLALAQGKVRELTEQLAELRRELATKLGYIAQLEAQRRQTDATLQSQVQQSGAQLDAATRAHRAALRDLGEQAVSRGLAHQGGERGSKAEQAVAARKARQREERLYTLAVDAFERKPMVRGLALLGGAAFIIFVMIVTAIVL